MAITVYPDLVEGSGLQTIRNGGSRIIRTFFVDGITVNDRAAFHTTAITAPGIPRRFDAHPSAPQLQVTGIESRVIPGCPSQCIVLVTYEDRQVGGVPTEKLAIRETVTLAQETIRRHPRTLEPTRVWRGTRGTEKEGKILDAPFSLPLRNKILYGLFEKERPESWRQGIGCVNMREFMNFPPGFWLCSYYDEQWSNIDRKYRVTVGFSNKQIYDWSTWGQMRETTGEFVPVDAATTALISRVPYAYDILWEEDGIGRFGFYPLCDFAALYQRFLTLPQPKA